MKTAAMFLLVGATRVLLAQPSDAQIRADLMKPGVLNIRFTSTGTKQWNRDTRTFEFVRGVEILRQSDMPNVKLLVVGDAVYQSYPAGYRYWKFRVIENRYDGLANPSPGEIAAILSKDPVKVYGGAASVVLAPSEAPKLAGQPEWTWHTPNSVSFLVTLREKMRVRNTEIEIADQDYEVRLYRSAPGQPWNNFISSPASGPSHRRVIEKKSYTEAELRAMRTVFQAGR